jgi:hypothetical protein
MALKMASRLNNYKIYLTQSRDSTASFARTHHVNRNGVLKITHGDILPSNDIIPNIYKDRGLFHCTIEFEREDGKKPAYEIIFIGNR